MWILSILIFCKPNVRFENQVTQMTIVSSPKGRAEFPVHVSFFRQNIRPREANALLLNGERPIRRCLGQSGRCRGTGTDRPRASNGRFPNEYISQWTVVGSAPNTPTQIECLRSRLPSSQRHLLFPRDIPSLLGTPLSHRISSYRLTQLSLEWIFSI